MGETDRDTAAAGPGAAAEGAEGSEQRQAGEPDLSIEARLERAENAAADFREQFLRTAAELENVRRRAARDVESARRYGVERFAREMLAVVDSLEIGLESARGAGESGAVAEGMDATLRLLVSALEKFDVTPIEALGAPFDPDAHEAIMTQPSSEAEPDTVIGVIQQGFRIHDRLLRPARVIVARAPDA
ncbi:nucleotide exchange factor GrpE [Wenzhouxiangella sp. XN24]|uniref:nucleotide exchange factor GrpE n=1 Tax=Wenzhouxiangella sp. XN24 TaxID=2713569 RepID=UPI001F0D7752|nr:nucleotide exchange factor GrpE [Wenzhouxiangella sp. XN24]